MTLSKITAPLSELSFYWADDADGTIWDMLKRYERAHNFTDAGLFIVHAVRGNIVAIFAASGVSFSPETPVTKI